MNVAKVHGRETEKHKWWEEREISGLPSGGKQKPQNFVFNFEMQNTFAKLFAWIKFVKLTLYL